MKDRKRNTVESSEAGDFVWSMLGNKMIIEELKKDLARCTWTDANGKSKSRWYKLALLVKDEPHGFSFWF